MAYLQTTAVSVSDVLNSIATFATSLGWTVQRNNTFVSGANSRRILSLSMPGFDYAHFFGNLGTSQVQISTMRSISYSGAADVGSEPEKSCSTASNFITAGPYVNLWLFGEAGTSPYIHCVIEYAAGRYRHFGIGNIVKKGTWTGGGYHYGTFVDQSFASTTTAAQHVRPFCEYTNITGANRNSIRCDNADKGAAGITGVDNRYVSYAYTLTTVNTASSGFGYTGYSSNSTNAYAYVAEMGAFTHGLSAFNQRVSLVPISHYIARASNYLSYIGDTPAMRAVDVTPFEPQEEYVIGTDTWKIFPMIRKGLSLSGATDEFAQSGPIGMAYKKVI